MNYDIKLHFKQINTLNDFDEFFENISEKYEESLNDDYKKHNGIFFTRMSLADHMVNEMFELHLNKDIDNLDKKLFLEPAVGFGVFVFAFLKKIKKLNLSTSSNYDIVHNIYVSDIDEKSLNIFNSIYKEFVNKFFDIKLDADYTKNNISSGLVYINNNDEANYISLEKAYPNLQDRFSIIITNPPYKNLRALRREFTDEKSFLEHKNYYQSISTHAKRNFSYANEGVINIYKLFVEEIISNYSKKDAILSLLIPTTILTDRSCTKLRNLILDKNSLLSIKNIKESNDFFNASQSLSTLLIKKGYKTETFRYVNELNLDDYSNHTLITYSELKKITNSNIIISLNNDEFKLMQKMSKHTKLKDLKFIINMRGELDLSLFKKNVFNTKSDYKLIRGRDIGEFKLKTENEFLFTNKDFVDNSPKNNYISQTRIACQQVSNINKEKRLIFSLIEPNNVLGNSCNFISVNENNSSVDLYYLLGLLNSNLLNWYFKKISSNNHVNNYELDLLPIPLSPKKIISEISSTTKALIEDDYNSILLEKLNSLVSDLFNTSTLDNKKSFPSTTKEKTVQNFYNSLKLLINNNDLKLSDAKDILENKTDIKTFMVKNNIINNDIIKESFINFIAKYQKLLNNEVLNHFEFKLSELDIEMITPVPPGGNWQDIPEDVVKKSKRLERITQTGGRTTLYGRLDYEQPSYTITTYFNRPGNGTYVHPNHDRVITVREAARLQSFPDHYLFYGNQGNLLNQIGNAVPPLLSYYIGKQIKSKINIKNSIDLFAGAGGLSYGLSKNNIKSLLAIDFDKAACITYKINNPNSKVIFGDLTDENTKNDIYSYLSEETVDLVCGGPPCQGFSLAGKRFIDDPRNRLFKDYLDVLKNVNPKVFIFENVVGLLSMQKGKIYEEIIKSFTEAGYVVSSKKIMASDFGVPQRRQRVFIIGVRKDIKISPKELFPENTKLMQHNTRDAIYDLENIETSNSLNPSIKSYYKDHDMNEYLKLINNLEA